MIVIFAIAGSILRSGTVIIPCARKDRDGMRSGCAWREWNFSRKPREAGQRTLVAAKTMTSR